MEMIWWKGKEYNGRIRNDVKKEEDKKRNVRGKRGCNGKVKMMKEGEEKKEMVI